MDFPFNSSVNILGTTYSIEVKKKEEAEGFKGHLGAAGFTTYAAHLIVLRDVISDSKLSDDEIQQLIIMMKKTLRHEIVHAFLYESGLDRNTSTTSYWARNEEMVDWIALQGPKMLKAWEEAGAL